MPRKNPEREARRERRRELTEFLDSVGVSDVAGVQELFKDLIGSVLENGFEGGNSTLFLLQSLSQPNLCYVHGRFCA